MPRGRSTTSRATTRGRSNRRKWMFQKAAWDSHVLYRATGSSLGATVARLGTNRWSISPSTNSCHTNSMYPYACYLPLTHFLMFVAYTTKGPICCPGYWVSRRNLWLERLSSLPYEIESWRLLMTTLSNSHTKWRYRYLHKYELNNFLYCQCCYRCSVSSKTPLWPYWLYISWRKSHWRESLWRVYSCTWSPWDCR